MITDQQKSAKDQMLMVITNDVECNIPLEWDHCTKKIGSFKKVSEFEKKVKDFLAIRNYASNTEDLLEQVIIILQIEHDLFYRVADNQNANKLIVLLIHNQESYFPLIFRRKWKLVYVDHLLSTKSISSKDLTNSVADTINKQCKSNLVGCACRAFGKLHFPRSMDCLSEKKRLSDLFEKEEFKECEAIIEERLKIFLLEATRKRSIEEILRGLSFQSDKKEGPFFEKYQSIVDTLLILTFVNVLLVIYENGGFKVLPNLCFTKKKNQSIRIHQELIYLCVCTKKYFESKQRNNTEYAMLFERALCSSELVAIEAPNITTNQLVLIVIDPQLYAVRMRSKSLFPFSHCFHKWCQEQFLCNKDLADDRPTYCVTTLEQIPIGNENLKQWELVCSEKANRIYAMDLVRKYFSWSLHNCKQRRVLRDIIVAIALLSCGKISIATIEVAMHCFHSAISHYAHIIAMYFLCNTEFQYVYEDNSTNTVGQWLVDVTRCLWNSIPLTKKRFSHSGQFPLLEDVRRLELRHLGLRYLSTDEFINEEKQFTGFTQSLLKNGQCVEHILSSYNGNRNSSNEKYPLFVRDLLAIIKRVEDMPKNSEPQRMYTSLLLNLHEKNKEDTFLQVQLLRDMCIHQCVNNNTLLLHSKDAVLLNRCLEQMLLNADIDDSTINSWEQYCHDHGHDKLELVIKISKLKIELTKLIMALINIDINVSSFEQEHDAHNLIERMGALLSSSLALDDNSYKYMLHVWFLKQLHMCKGIHWIEVIFTHSKIRQAVPLFSNTVSPNTFGALDPRPAQDFYNPLLGVYGKNFMDKVYRIIQQTDTFNLDISCPMLANFLFSANLYNFSFEESQLKG
ncbi:hypothetical protein RFI_28756 [Reticulomyxa filosa]|uniref:Uncharacterized protein n=1 Tax=Reticulomyxa filosa TaxID=46433 RepID=X6M588_RETFI|nr:hypothetical protein RFI_28756 [Reticulomyxa filosa]|eukprot:ETO08632.1 hypothetical protein RFI_28756 [Reticulomyxa filosa]